MLNIIAVIVLILLTVKYAYRRVAPSTEILENTPTEVRGHFQAFNALRFGQITCPCNFLMF